MKKEKVKINVKERLEDNVLDLSLSGIEHIEPYLVKDIASCRRVTVVDLSSNSIKFLPKNFGVSLVQLSRLDLSKNQLKFLHEDFCNLTNLKHLDLYNNQLENLPVQFGKLNKLRYLDLKGNPLVPTLAKIVGPCLTSKECCDAAKNIVPFMIDLEKKFEAEKKKQEAAEAKRKEEEVNLLKEQIWIAKKAARKERVMRERQEKAEAMKADQGEESATRETKNSVNESVKVAKKPSESRNVLSFLKTFISVVILLGLIFVAFLKFLPEQSEKVLALLPSKQQEVLRFAFEKINGSIFGVFEKVLSSYRM